jgi:hypothetical protein
LLRVRIITSKCKMTINTFPFNSTFAYEPYFSDKTP